MNIKAIPVKFNILLVEDNPGDAVLISEYLSESALGQFNVFIEEKLSDAKNILERKSFDAIILDLNLPDSNGLETFTQIQNFKSDIATIILTGLSDELIGMEAVKNGAQDYLVKNKINEEVLGRAIFYAIARKKDQVRMHHLYRVLFSIRNVNQLITHVDNQEKLISEACNLLIEYNEYNRAIILLFDDENNIISLANSGLNEIDLPFSTITDFLQLYPCFKTTIQQDDLRIMPGHSDECLKCVSQLKCDWSFYSSFSKRLQHKDQIFGIIGVAVSSQYITDKEEHSLFNEVVGDISYALYSLSQTKEKELLHLKIEESFEKLKIAKQKAEESDRLKSVFLSNMSHEIRTPLNGIIGFSNLLDDPVLSDNQKREYIQVINNSGDQLLQIINDIIDISKIESNQLKISKSSCDIRKIIENLLLETQNSNLFKSKSNIKLNANISNLGKYSIIISDAVRLKQVLTNLINNALKFTNKGFIEVGVSFPDNIIEPQLLFYVKDTGIGIPLEKQTIIFERFRQVDEQIFHEGAGLGLSISKGIIELLEGQIWVESKINNGSTFYFVIPAGNERKNEFVRL